MQDVWHKESQGEMTQQSAQSFSRELFSQWHTPAAPAQCDGQHPCNTCVKSGDRCDYGTPKKRGPPKGSTRSSARSGAAMQLASSDSSSNSTSPRIAVPLASSSSSQNHSMVHSSFPSQSHARIPSAENALDSSEPAGSTRFAFDPVHMAPSPYASTSQLPPPFTARSDSPRSNVALPPPPLPRASQSIVDSRHGSYMSLPDPSGGFASRPKFRGGSSGILDFPSPSLRGPLYHGSPSSNASAVGATSPSSFALSGKRCIDESSGALTPNGSHTLTKPSIASPLARLAPFSSSSSSNVASPRPDSFSNGAASNNDTISNSFINSLELARSGHDRNAAGNTSDVVPPRCIHYPQIPEATEDTIWTLWWQIIAMHWPILLADVLPVIRGQPRVDIHKQPLLFNAVAALASRIWDLEKDGPPAPMQLPDGVTTRSPTCGELSDIYFVRARYWLLRTECEASLEVAQALLCMSLRESGSGRSSPSAEYCMSACRTALDLGLHREFSNRGLSKDETQARLRTWWCIYTLDKTNSAMLGRPCVLRYEESDAPFFDVEKPEEYWGWQPSRYDDSPASKLLAGKPVRSLSYFVWACRLGAICENIVLQYNNVRSKAETCRAIGGNSSSEPWDVTVNRLHHKLEEWDASVPPHLREQTDGPTSQHVLCQRIWYCACRIILHRPYILRESTDPTLPPSHLVCKEAALELCRLVSKYKRDHGTRKLSSTLVYCVFTAATILLADTTSPVVSAAQEAKRCLAECTQHLGNMSGTWTNATVHLNILRHLGRSLDADMAGTGLEAVASADDTAPVGAVAARNGPSGSSSLSGAVSSPAAVAAAAAPAVGVANGGRPPQYNTQRYSLQQQQNVASTPGQDPYHLSVPPTQPLPNARTNLSEERFFEINDGVRRRCGDARNDGC